MTASFRGLSAICIGLAAGLLASLSMWALCVQAFFRAYGYALYITWFPAYLEQGRTPAPDHPSSSALELLR